MINLRHCAFCVKPIFDSSINLCGGCRRRAYCSKECQLLDWKVPGHGQCHKNWCKVMCGEEDLDWEVIQDESGSSHLYAKKFIPVKSRIMVEGFMKLSYPDVLYLDPKPGSLEEEQLTKRVALGEGVCRRLSLAKHACSPNSHHHYDDEYEVKVLFSLKDIQPGEEITMTYSDFSFDDLEIVQSRYDFTCPLQCVCHNEEFRSKVKKRKELLEKVEALHISPITLGGLTRDDLQVFRDLIKLDNELHSSWISKQEILLYRYHLCMRLRRYDEALDSVKDALDIEKSIIHPESSDAVTYQKYISNIKVLKKRRC